MKTNKINDFEEAIKENKGLSFRSFALAALGSIPIVGGAISGVGGAWSERDQNRINSVFKAWLKVQEEELEQIGKTLSEVLFSINLQDEKIVERIESHDYSNIIKKCFRDWSAGDSEDKRLLLKNLLTNAATSKITSDDVIKLFVEWIGKYSDLHFKVISFIYKNENYTRNQIWYEIYHETVREDSAEADLFKLVIHELSVGHVIRQFRPTDRSGNFLKQTNRRPQMKTQYVKSAFDNEKQYVLTELGKQFVHYTMNDIITKIEMKDEENK